LFVIETPRLFLRPFEPDDVEAAFAWLSDPDVMRFIPAGPHTTVAKTRTRIAEYRAQQAARGFSKWIVIEKESGQSIGDSGLLVLNELGPMTDLGFRFAKAYWGRGYATEVATAWIKMAFEKLGLDRLSAFAHVDNLASRRVLEKVGFQYQTRQLVMGMDSATYALGAGDYAGSKHE
jgi:RimJ/RimL family protein N-acetyltransferase